MQKQMKKKIGEGYWYNVYDLENGRILKIQKRFPQKVQDSFKIEKNNLLLWFRTVWNFVKDVKVIRKNYDFIRKNVDLSILGNPTFLNAINYEQDKVVVLADILSVCNFFEKERIVDLYIDNLIECWKNGIGDKLFNFTINNGLDSSGKLIFIDFNEITLNKVDVKKRIDKKIWTKAWSLTQVDGQTKNYYLKQMHKRVNCAALEKYWGLNIKS